MNNPILSALFTLAFVILFVTFLALIITLHQCVKERRQLKDIRRIYDDYRLKHPND